MGILIIKAGDEAAEIFESRENLIHFLFNPRSFFITDNDNH